MRLVKEDGLSSFEKDCLNLAFSGKKRRNSFQFVLRITRYLIVFIVEQKFLMKNGFKQGRQLKSSLKKYWKEMQRRSEKSVTFWGLPGLLPSLTGGEKALQVGMGLSTICPYLSDLVCSCTVWMFMPIFTSLPVLGF